MNNKTNLDKLRAAIKKLGPDAEFTVSSFPKLTSVSQNLVKLSEYHEEIICMGKRGGKKIYRIKTEDPRLARWKEVWPEMFAMPAIQGAVMVVKLEDRRL